MSLGREQRKHPRLSCTGTAEVFLSTEDCSLRGRVANLSAEGCLLILRKPEELDRDDFLELAFTVNGLPFRVRGQVKAIRSKTEFGLRFPSLSDRSRTQIGDLIEELREAQRVRRGGLELKAP